MAREQRHIGSYRDAELIGRGGFGSVYRADDPDHGRQVAIKVLDVELGEAERRRFDRERRLMGQLGSHPNIISVYDSGYTDRDEAYIVMELASEGSLRSELDRRGRFEWHDAVKLMGPIASAVAAAHDRDIVHRDIKPDNILIDDYGNPRLTDFGIATLTSGATSTQAASATLAHAAPEVLDGKQAGHATDVYALASTLHTLIAGSPPFMRSAEEGLGVMMRRIMAEPPPDLRPFGVPDEVAVAIEQSLAKSPDDRPLTARAFAEAITAGLQHPNSTTPRSTESDVPATATPSGSGLGDHPTITEPPAEFVSTDPFLAPDAPGPTPSPATVSVAGALGSPDRLSPGVSAPGVSAPGVSAPGVSASGVPVIVASPPKRQGLLLAAVVAFAVLAIGGAAFALGGGDDDGDDISTAAEADTTTTTVSSTTVSSTTVSTTATTGAPTTADGASGTQGALAQAEPSVGIDCPIEIALGSTLVCSITTSGVVSGEWSLPGFLSEPLPIQTINGVNDIFIEPSSGEAAGRRYTITATATTEAGEEISAKRTFLINVPTVEINCPSQIAPGDTVVCEIVSKHATRGTWEIPGFGGDVIETIPGSNAIFINPNESVIGQTFTASATVEDDFGLTATATSDFTVTASAGG